MRAAPPSAGRRGLALAGESRSSRPLVKTPGGCIRREIREKAEGQSLRSLYISRSEQQLSSAYAFYQQFQDNGHTLI